MLSGIAVDAQRHLELAVQERQRIDTPAQRLARSTEQELTRAVPQRARGAGDPHAGDGGKLGAGGRALYPASKAALMQYTKNAAVTLAPRGIRVLTVSPGWTWSPAMAAAMAAIVVGVNRLVWKQLYRVAERRFSLG